MTRIHNKKGLAAILDAILAFSVAFVCIGFVLLMLMNTHEEDLKTTYSLNVWAEDLADAVGMSLIKTFPDTSWEAYWLADDLNLDDPNTPLVLNLQRSLEKIYNEIGASVWVEIGTETFYMPGSKVNANGVFEPEVETVATATRVFRDDSGSLDTLTVKVGI